MTIKSLEEIIAAIDQNIADLQTARRLLAGADKAQKAVKPAVDAVKRSITPEGRKKIAAAQRRRWAKQKAKK